MFKTCLLYKIQARDSLWPNLASTREQMGKPRPREEK